MPDPLSDAVVLPKKRVAVFLDGTWNTVNDTRTSGASSRSWLHMAGIRYNSSPITAPELEQLSESAFAVACSVTGSTMKSFEPMNG